MKYLITMIIMFASLSSQIIFDFNPNTDLKDWLVVDDVVMGGRSSGSLELSPEGHGVFKGNVSLENNGGFSSVRHRFERISVKGYTKIVLKIKGDGKKYQFRLKANSRDYYSYISYFSTNGDWQEIQIPLEVMYPTFRGRKLEQPNFSGEYIEEIAFLIGNKNEEEFQLFIDTVALR
ncbi:CIA30 family protein [Aquimarina spongiae]|nr:CIA30 family protein [Aquimarina spongiae]